MLRQIKRLISLGGLITGLMSIIFSAILISALSVPAGALTLNGPPPFPLHDDSGNVHSLDSVANCNGNGWQTDANADYHDPANGFGGALGFAIDLKDIGDFWGGPYATMVNSSGYQADFGRIACVESTFDWSAVYPPAPNTDVWGMFQVWATIFTYSTWNEAGFTNCSATAFMTTGCDGFTLAETQMTTALWYCLYNTNYNGNPDLAWAHEVSPGGW